MNRPDRGPLWAECLPVTLLFSLLTLLLAYPLSVHPATHVLPHGADTDLMLWLFGWDVHALTHQPWSMFDGNIYYPYQHTVAYSENLIGSAILTAPIVWLTGNLVLAMNAAALLSCVLCGVGAYVLGRRLGLGPIGALVAGLIFAFAPPRFFRIGQLHLTTVQWLPFCLASLYAYFESGNRRDLRWACTFFLFQVYTSGHGAVLTAVSIAALIIWRIGLGEPILPFKRLRDLGAPGVIVLALTVLPFVPYRAVQQEMGLRRSLSDAYQFAPNVESFLASPSHVDQFLTSMLTDVPVLQRAKALLFPGYLTLILAAAGVFSLKRPPRVESAERASGWRRATWGIELLAFVFFLLAVVVTFQGGIRLRYQSDVIFSARQPWRIWVQCLTLVAIRLALIRRVPLEVSGRLHRLGGRFQRWSRRLRPEPRAFFLVLGVLTLWLALGPGFGLYNLVYDWPGFSFIRVPSRFTILTLLALAVLAGAGVEHWISGLARNTQPAIALLIGALLVGEFASIPLTTVPYPRDVPPIERWLAAQPKPFVVAEIPVVERLQGTYMVHSMAHWQKTVHGYSGMRPALHSALYDEMATFPDARSLASLAGLGVTHVVVHTELYGPGEWPIVERRLGEFSDWLRLEHIEGEGRVYTLRNPASLE